MIVKIQKNKNAVYSNIFKIFYALISSFFIVMMIIMSYNALSLNAFFAPYNGTFQNFNPMYRIMNGDLPIKDYDDYLGIGVNYFQYPFFRFFGHDFVASKQGAMLAHFIAFVASGLILARLSRMPLILGLVLVSFFMSLGFNYLSLRFNDLLLAAESSFGVRSFGPILFCFILILSRIDLSNLDKKSSFIIGIILGSFTFWSNDYGVPLVLVFSLFMMVLSINQGKIKTTFPYFIFGGVLSVVFLLILLGRENFLEWFIYNYEIGKYQYGFHSHYAWNSERDLSFFISPFFILLFAFFIYGVIISFLHKKTFDILLLTIIATEILGLTLKIYSYHLFDRQFASGYRLIPFLVFWVLQNHIDFNKIKETWKSAFMAICCFFIFFIQTVLFMTENPTQRQHGMQRNLGEEVVSELGGRLYKYDYDLKDFGNSFRDENIKSFVMTYRSALAHIAQAKSPVRNDYLIHASGPRTLRRYVYDFEKDNSEVAVTMNREIMGYDAWLERKAWPFYRSLQQRYRPVENVAYSWIWRKREKALEIKGEFKDCKIEKTESNRFIVHLQNNEDRVFQAEIKLNTSFLGSSRKFVSVDESNTGLDLMITRSLTPQWSYDSQRQEALPVILKKGENTVVYTGATRVVDGFLIENCQYRLLWPLDQIRLPDTFYPDYLNINVASFLKQSWSLEVLVKNVGEIHDLRIGSIINFPKRKAHVIGIEYDRIMIDALDESELFDERPKTLEIEVKKDNMDRSFDWIRARKNIKLEWCNVSMCITP